MNYRPFGSTDLRVSEIGFGCSRLGGTVEHKDDKEVLAALLDGLEQGVNFYDTADSYAQGRSEQLLGKAFRHRRASVIIATKAGYRLRAAGSLAASLKPLFRPFLRMAPRLLKSAARARGSQINQDFSPDYLRRAIDSSLQRLQTDYIDVFQLHSPPSSVIEAGEFIEVLYLAKSQGKIRWYGVSCLGIEDAVLCLRHPGIHSVQIPINLLAFESALSFLELAKRKGIAVIARQALASGFLSRAASLIGPEQFSMAQKEFDQKLAQARTYAFLELGARRTIAQAALQFVLQLPGVSVAIVGMSSRKHLTENLAPSACPLTEGEIARIHAIRDPGFGTRDSGLGNGGGFAANLP